MIWEYLRDVYIYMDIWDVVVHVGNDGTPKDPMVWLPYHFNGYNGDMWRYTWVISHVPIFHITQPLGIWSIMATIR